MWEDYKTDIPEWIDGVYVRNGPAQLSFGSDKRVFTSWLDGYAKLHSFKFRKGKVLFSGKMLEPPNYVASMKKGELTPQMTLNKFKTKEEEWSWVEKAKIAEMMMMKTAFDNNNPALWRIGKKDAKKGIYLATTDYPMPMRFNISDLSTLGIQYPPSYPITMSGCAHWMREVGTDNSLNVQVKMGVTGTPFALLMRWRPQDTYLTPETVATFYPKKISYIHSFSITKNYAILFFYPVGVDPMSFFSSGFHIMETIGKIKNTETDVYVVDLRTGKVTEFLNHDLRFSIHTANAYETAEGLINVDLVTNDYTGLRDFYNLEKIMHPPEKYNISGRPDLVRQVIDLKKMTIKTVRETDVKPKDEYVNHFEFPIINEAYRGRSYCILYGWSMYGYTHMVLTKKNLCNPNEDKIWHVENHYSSEMWFVANPQPKSEDDGMLITVVFDGMREQSYLLILDAITFTLVNKAYLPHNIPMSAHGMYYPEVKE